MFPIESLDSELKSIDRCFDSINCGGCACFAAMIAERLEQYIDKMRIVSCTRGGDTSNSIDECRSKVNNLDKEDWYAIGIGFSHLWVEGFIDGRHMCIDSTGVYFDKELYRRWNTPFDGSFTLEEIKSFAKDSSGWNPCFDRGQLPAIEGAFDESLSRIL